MKTLTIDFRKEGVSLNLDRVTEGFHATAQAALVNMGTTLGTDKTYPERGTPILKAAVSGRLVSQQAAQHAVNFAAVDTVYFVRANEPVDSGEKLAEIVTDPIIQGVDHLVLRLHMRGSDGTELGTITDFPTDA